MQELPDGWKNTPPLQGELRNTCHGFTRPNSSLATAMMEPPQTQKTTNRSTN